MKEGRNGAVSVWRLKDRSRRHGCEASLCNSTEHESDNIRPSIIYQKIHGFASASCPTGTIINVLFIIRKRFLNLSRSMLQKAPLPRAARTRLSSRRATAKGLKAEPSKRRCARAASVPAAAAHSDCLSIYKAKRKAPPGDDAFLFAKMWDYSAQTTVLTTSTSGWQPSMLSEAMVKV